SHVGSLAPTFDGNLWRDLGQRALPIGAFLILLNLYSYVDSVMLMAMRGEVETGLYSAAYRIFEGAVYGAAVLSAVLTPRLSSEFVRDRTRFASLARAGLVASVGTAAVLGLAIAAIAGPLLTHLFLDPSFVRAARALHILCAGLVVTYPIWILQ